MKFEKRVSIEIKLLGIGLAMLTAFCSYHEIVRIP